MYNSDTYALSGTPEELSRVLRCDVAEFNIAMSDLAKHNAAVLERRNGIVTITSRRLERLHKSRESGRLRKHNQRERQKCHAKVPSAYTSAYESSDGNGDRGKGRNLAPQMQAEIGKHFNRKPGDRWSYEEEFLLVEICKRASVESEWLEIIQFRKVASKQGDKMRESVKTLLENWQGELDRARKLKPKNHIAPCSAEKLLSGVPVDSTLSERTKAEWDRMKKETFDK